MVRTYTARSACATKNSSLPPSPSRLSSPEASVWSVGILERLTRPARSPRERFAGQVLAELRRLGFRDAEFRPTQFAIVCEYGQDVYSWLFLSKAFTQYQRSPGDRKQFVREFVAHSLAPPVQPASFADALPNLRLAL